MTAPVLFSDELKFIPIIGSPAGIEVGSFLKFFSLTHFKVTHKKKSIWLPQHFKPHLPT
jgi:hypothetical protein